MLTAAARTFLMRFLWPPRSRRRRRSGKIANRMKTVGQEASVLSDDRHRL